MSSLKLALGSTFTAVTDTMNGVGTTVKAVAKGASALNDYVDQLRYKQVTDYAIERITYSDTAIKKAAEKTLREEERLEEYLNEKPDRAKSFEKIRLEIKEAVDKSAS